VSYRKRHQPAITRPVPADLLRLLTKYADLSLKLDAGSAVLQDDFLTMVLVLVEEVHRIPSVFSCGTPLPMLGKMVTDRLGTVRECALMLIVR
jgi:hypothetical protein